MSLMQGARLGAYEILSALGAGGMGDFAPDGRFVVIRPAQEETGGAAPPALVLVQNWFEELKRLVPTN